MAGLLQAVAARLGVVGMKSVVVQPDDAASILGTFVLDCCEVQGLRLPTDITDYPVGGDDITDNIRHGPPELSVSGWIATNAITFGAAGSKVFAALDALTPLDTLTPKASAANVSGVGGADPDAVFPPGRANEILGQFLAMRASKKLFTVTLSWLTLQKMAIGAVNIDRDGESGDAFPISITFRRVKIVSSAKLASVADADAAARGGDGVTDLGTMSLTSSPQQLPLDIGPLTSFGGF